MDGAVHGLLTIGRISGGWTMKAKRGFTLIELLVVISIVALLMAILLPALGRVRKQGKAVACQAKLRQWGVVFSMYMDEHDGKVDAWTWSLPWWRWMHAYYADCNDLLLCPMAARYELNKNDPKWEANVAVGWGPGSRLTAWKVADSVAGHNVTLYGSYGTNGKVCSPDTAMSMAGARVPGQPSLLPSPSPGSRVPRFTRQGPDPARDPGVAPSMPEVVTELGCNLCVVKASARDQVRSES
jgi:prepilin-type N-terminal cleavage/methylation domain-containing protein